MGRRKIEIKAIKDDRNRSVTFLKRKGGLFKKAHELSVLCSVDVAVIIFGHNKKLYEFSSGDIRETLGKYQYWGPPHEHKGPNDFAGKGGGDDDDDDDEDVGPEDLGPPQPQDRIPPHLPNQPGFQHIHHAPSASPPIPNGVGFDPRHGTPHSQGASRPSSRNHGRRVSTQYGGHALPQAHATPPPPANGFAYVPNPSMYNPGANGNMAQQPPRPNQFQSFAPPPPPSHPMQQPPPHHHGVPQLQHQPMPQAQPYMQDQGRHSMPPALPAESQPPLQRNVGLPDASVAQHANETKDDGSQSPRGPSSKSRSIFTPIDDQTSVFSRHFLGVGSSLRESPQRESATKLDPHPASQTIPLPAGPVGTGPMRAATEPQRSQSTASRSEIRLPSRTSSVQVNAKRPRLKVQIPSEQSDGGSATAESSPRDSADRKGSTPAKTTSETGHPGVVLPPPSPSAGALLSAGAQGPPNPFARPPPPGSNSQNGTSYGSNNNETPISALPSRFVSDALLPSPSSFFSDWNFGRSGPDTNMLPSPLTFPTPSGQSGPGFAREDDTDKKRKSPDGGVSADAPGKKVKT